MQPLRVSSVAIKRHVCPDPRLKAFVSIVLNDDFAVKEMKIIERSDGLFVAMPNCRGKDGLFHDLAHPLDQPARDLVHSAVLDAFDSAVRGASERFGFFTPLPNRSYDCPPEIEVSHVTIRPHTSADRRLQGFATIILNSAFVVKNIKIIHGSTGWFVAMPSRKWRDGVFRDVAHPLRQNVRHMIEGRILEAYSSEMSRRHAAGQHGIAG